jgi:hypothetical protein
MDAQESKALLTAISVVARMVGNPSRRMKLAAHEVIYSDTRSALIKSEET